MLRVKEIAVIFIFISIQLVATTTPPNDLCGNALILTSQDMGNFNTAAYNPLNLQNLFSRLNSLQACVLTTYQLCFNKIIIDPSSLYPQDVSQCMVGLYNVSLLEKKYTGNYGLIYSDIDKIAKIVFSTQNDCSPVWNYKGADKIEDDCRDGFGSFRELIGKYEDQIFLGKDGLQFVGNMTLQVERLRKYCGLNTLIKAKSWKEDTCKAANMEWLYPLNDQLDIYIMKNMTINMTKTIYGLYQSLYRVRTVCNITQEGDNLAIQ